MAFFPPSQNADYRGARSAVVFLGIWALSTLIPGMIHAFAPDGGTETIAGLDLGNRRELVISVFAWMGAAQIIWAAAAFAVVWRYRPLTSFFLAQVVFERFLIVLRGWIVAPPISGHHPPEHYVALVVLPAAVVFLILSLRRRDGIAR